MAAIADVLIGIIALIMEALFWSLVATYAVLKAVFTRTGRADLKSRWAKGRRERAVIILGPAIWMPIFMVGFGIGIPLIYRSIESSSHKEETIELKGIAEIVIDHPELEDTEIIIRIDRSRMNELKDTKDIPDLIEKAREISEVELRNRKAEQTL